MIRPGDSPEGIYNKFISKSGEGQSGVLLALNQSSDKGIIIAVNGSFDPKGAKYGFMYLVEEILPDQYPQQVKKVDHIPDDFLILDPREESK